MKPAVLNASPLIILARAGYLEVVPKLVAPVVIRVRLPQRSKQDRRKTLQSGFSLSPLGSQW